MLSEKLLGSFLGYFMNKDEEVTMMDDLVRRRSVIRLTWEEPAYYDPINVLTELREKIKALPSAEPERKYTLEEVSEILASAIGDECACNINGIDEWLPERCKYTEIAEECPNPKEKHGCWMQFLIQGGADMGGK